jgi:hypothetical protein
VGEDPRSWRAINRGAQRSQRATHDARSATLAAFIAGRSDTAGTPLVVRSFMTQVTIFDGAVITILRVRQHPVADAQGLPNTETAVARTHGGSGVQYSGTVDGVA